MDKNTKESLRFIKRYVKASNASTGSEVDSNANIVQKNVATLQCELGKTQLLKLNRALTEEYLLKRYGRKSVRQFRRDLKKHRIYSHDETSIFPYCCSISLYPFLLNGLKQLGGSSDVPKKTDSFIGGLINLVFLVAGQFAGAVAIPEFMTYLDHFLRLDYGQDYVNHLDDVVEFIGPKQVTLRTKITDWFQQFVYSVNQPAGARNYQSPFTNIAYFDKYYFESIFKDFIFPDLDSPCWETTKELQKLFMKWFNKERTKAILTFPVESANILVEDNKYKDEEMADFFAEMWSEGHSFFMYQSDSVDALASCCRLRNAVDENVFSYTLGAGGVETGSKKVITLNINRLVQDWYRKSHRLLFKYKGTLAEYVKTNVERIHKYLNAWNDKLWDDYNNDILTVYKAGFIDLDKQFLTVGINGFVEGAEFLKLKGFDIDIDPLNESYKKYAHDILGTIKELNTKDRTEHCRYNTEFVPAENAASKLYKWDKKDHYWVPQTRNLYNSYFYIVEDKHTDPVKKFYFQGKGFASECDGGVALHCNLENHLTKNQYRKLMDTAVRAGCNYFTFNIPGTRCKDCGHIDKRFLHECPECHSKNLVYHTRIIGYLKEVESWPEPRQKEFNIRYFDNSLESNK